MAIENCMEIRTTNQEEITNTNLLQKFKHNVSIIGKWAFKGAILATTSGIGALISAGITARFPAKRTASYPRFFCNWFWSEFNDRSSAVIGGLIGLITGTIINKNLSSWDNNTTQNINNIVDDTIDNSRPIDTNNLTMTRL